MAWINLTDAERQIILDRLEPFDAVPEIDLLAQRIADAGDQGVNDMAYANAAFENHRLSDPDEYEGTPGGEPFVSESDDGAYVMAWIWVDRCDIDAEDDEDETYSIQIREIASGDLVVDEEFTGTLEDAQRRLSDEWNACSVAVLNGDRYRAQLIDYDKGVIGEIGANPGD